MREIGTMWQIGGGGGGFGSPGPSFERWLGFPCTICSPCLDSHSENPA